MSVSKPKHGGGDRDPNKQKNIYRTKYIIGMNITKTNTKEETFTNVLLGKEENNKDATETQGKTTQRV